MNSIELRHFDRSSDFIDGEWTEVLPDAPAQVSYFSIWLTAIKYGLLGAACVLCLVSGFLLGFVRAGVRAGDRAFDCLVSAVANIIVVWIVVLTVIVGWSILWGTGAPSRGAPSPAPNTRATDVTEVVMGTVSGRR